MILDLNNIYKVVNKLISISENKNIIILLKGDLASGKTTLVKEFVKALGLKDEVRSPTFSLQSIYANNIFHYDIYNKSLKEFVALGLLEEFDKSGIHFVEWGDDKLKSLLNEYGFFSISVSINKLKNEREYIIES